MTHRTRLALAGAGGAVTGAAFTTWPLQVLAPIGVALLIMSVHLATWRTAATAGALYGLAFMGTVLFWLVDSIGVAAWIALALVQSVIFAVAAVAIAATTRLSWWPCWAAVAWTAVENLRAGWPLGGMPWGRLAYAAPDTAWAQLLPTVGMTGTSFVLAALGSAMAAVVVAARQPGRRARLTLTGLLVAASLAPGLVSSPAFSNAVTGTTVSVGLVQGGVPGTGTRLIGHHREVTDNQAAETARLVSPSAGSDRAPAFVVWPENSMAVDPTTDDLARSAIESSVAAAGVPVLFGAITHRAGETSPRNQAIVWTDVGPGPRYTKQHLVPFGEYVPFRPLAERLSTRVADIRRDMVPGGEAQPLSIGPLEVAVALCFDVAYDDVLAPQVARGAELITVLTSNAMFLGTGQLDQQWTISRARALENGRSVVVASVNGISGVIAPDGTVLERLAVRATSSTTVEVPLSDDLMPAVRLGPWPTRLIYGVALVLAAFIVIRRVSCGRRRSRHDDPVRARSDRHVARRPHSHGQTRSRAAAPQLDEPAARCPRGA